jgi:hypothetical protein
MLLSLGEDIQRFKSKKRVRKKERMAEGAEVVLNGLKFDQEDSLGPRRKRKPRKLRQRV